jgi:nucleotide-binding universal stress UspA family protein
MLRILLPVDGSDNSNKSVSDFIRLLGWYRETPEIHLLNVQPPLHGGVSSFIDRENIKQYHQEEGFKGLQSARNLLEQAGIVYQPHILVGDPAEMIVHCATEKKCDQIVIGPRGLGGAKGLLMGSVANKLMQLSPLPVLLIK